MSELPVNEGRGEVAVTVDGVELVVAAEMERLAHLSARLQCATLHDLYQRLAGAEPAAMYACLDLFVLRGDAGAAKAALSLDGLVTLSRAMVKALAHHSGPSSGNARGAKAKS